MAIAYPEREGDDWNDVLQADGVATVRAAFEAALRNLEPPDGKEADLGKGAGDTMVLTQLDDLLRDRLHLKGSATAVPPAGGDPRPPTFSDEALALRFTARHADELRYVAAWGRWLRREGTRWAADMTLAVFDLVRRICRESSAEALRRETRGGDPVRLASAKTVAAIERLARADRRHAATVDQWDADPWLLNTPGGTVDLRTGRMRPHERTDYLTKMTAVAPADKPPAVWLGVLDRITGGDQDLVAFLQRMAGYCLTGVTRDQALFFGYGAGANGKGTTINTLVGVFADYAAVAGMETFTASQTDRHPTELAVLRGARLVTAQETEEGRRWAEARIKAMTGGDPITAHFMRQDPFTYIPQFKLLIAGNHKPSLRNVDDAMRRRLHLIPFTVTIPREERDQQLPEKLKGEWPAILAWAIQGCLEWQRVGLAPPEAVRSATENYFLDQNTIAAWIAECCDEDPNYVERSSILYNSYRPWAERDGEYTGSNKQLSQTLEKHYEKRRTSGGAQFIGLRVRQAGRWDDFD